MDNGSSVYDSFQHGGSHEVLKIEVFHGNRCLLANKKAPFFSFEGSDRHVLILRSANNLRVTDLMEELQRITTVPTHEQKLYYRGQELQLMRDRTLRESGIGNNAQIRLIGEPIKARYEPLITARRVD